ncbi:MAG: hypothetical protein ACR2H0_09110 [Candidatus Limnocylindrales bacterium]
MTTMPETGFLVIADLTGWVGPVVATADLEAAEGGTRSRVRWASQAEGVPAADEVSRIQDERAAAYARLGKIAAGSMPVIQ